MQAKLQSLLSRLRDIESEIVQVLGEETTPSPKKISTRPTTKAAKPTESLDYEVVITEAMARGQMKLPARLFGKYKTINFDGEVIKQVESDKGRSQRFSARNFGADEGDTFILTHTDRNNFDLTVVSGNAPAKKAKSIPSLKKVAPVEETPKKATKRRPVADVVRNATWKKSVAEFMQKFGQIACVNAAEGFVNQNVLDAGTFKDELDLDARQYLKTDENQRFKSGRKRLGLQPLEAVQMLNAEVFE